MKNQNMFLGINTLLKPLISPSLAWALGVNVVIAKPVENPPIVQTELGKKTIDFPTPTIGETETAGSISWADSTSQRGLINLISPDFTSKNSPANNISVKFDATKPTKSVIWTGGGLTYFVKATKDLNPKFIFNSNGHGIQLGADGKGDFKLQFKASENGTPTNILAELTFTNNTKNTALQGNLIIVGGYSNAETQNPNFSPQNHYKLSFTGNIEGNIDQSVWLSFPKTEGTKGWTPFGEITFTDRDDNSSRSITTRKNLEIFYLVSSTKLNKTSQMKKRRCK